MTDPLRPEFPEPGGGVLVADTVLTPTQTLRPGWVHITGARVTAVGAGTPPLHRHRRLPPGSVITPGFVDTHVHGGGGHTMTGTDLDETRAATAYHLRHGTTANLVSLITAPMTGMVAGLAQVATLTAAGRTRHGHVLGSHLEGPYLSVRRRGAHPSAHLRLPNAVTTRALLAAGHGTLRMLTAAPELPGILGPSGLINQVRTQGVTVAVGHTDASYEETCAALRDGARSATHLFNGMRPLHHRDPGPAGAVLDDPEAMCELINDGVHVHPAVARLTARVAGDGRLVLITDAVAATGAADGTYHLGEVAIRRREGVIRSADGSSLGGSDITMADAVRRAVQVLGLDLAVAVAAATGVPAAAIGCAEDVGALTGGRFADLVVLDSDLAVSAVMLAGSWIRPPTDLEPQLPTGPGGAAAISAGAVSGATP